jgi:curved DNA-binding protein CbpA
VTDIVELALACYRRPLDYQDRLSLAAPLPEGMDRLLWLANGSPEVLETGIRQTGAKSQELRDAARFCIQQWCLVRGADPHRVLGVEPGVPLEQIKEHYRLLMRLFHPDRAAGRETWTDHYASRINEAWTALSRTPDRAIPDSQPDPRPDPVPDTVHPSAEGAVERPGPLSSRPQPGRRPRARRRWLLQLVWGGLSLVAMMALVGFYLDQFSISRSGFEPTGAMNSAPSSGVATVPESSIASATDPGALGPFLVAPDWQALEQREQQARQQIAQAREAREQWEQSRRQQIAAEEALLEKMRADRARLEEQVKIEQARMEQARAERLAVEQQRLAQLQAEQARVEQIRTERESAERRRLEALQAEQAKAERLAEALRIERQRLERLQAEQARTEQARIEQAKMEGMQAERQRLEEQLKAQRARAEQARAERARREAAAPMATATAPEQRDLTPSELESLMSRYTRAYQRGDLNGVMALFAAGARGRIRGDYAALFAAHHIRGLWLRDLRWRYHGQSASGSGYYELQLRRRDNGEAHRMGGSIRFTVQKRDSQVLIEAIEYDWPES